MTVMYLFSKSIVEAWLQTLLYWAQQYWSLAVCTGIVVKESTKQIPMVIGNKELKKLCIRDNMKAAIKLSDLLMKICMCQGILGFS
jgi:hypothetical protein